MKHISRFVGLIFLLCCLSSALLPQSAQAETGELWTTEANLTTARYQHTATVLVDGTILVLGGTGSAGAVTDSEKIAVSDQARLPVPTINEGSLEASPGSLVTLTGSGFRGASEGGSGGVQNSPVDHPVVKIERAGVAAYWGAVSWNEAELAFQVPCSAALGSYNVSLIVNGVESLVVSLSVGGLSQGESCACDEACRDHGPGQCYENVGACLAEVCEYAEKPNGSSCTEGIQPGQCYLAVGTCANGTCGYPPKDEGSSCSDGIDCTYSDACDGSGNCVGLEYSCTPTQCQATSVCDGTGGCATTNLPDGTDCDDENLCSEDDACASGLCIGDPKICDQPPVATCQDWQTSRVYNTQGTCDPGDGVCDYTANTILCSVGCGGGCNDITGLCSGDPCCGVVCDDPPNEQCFESEGVCNGGACSYTQRNPGVSCDDGNDCTSSDRCDLAGNCTSVPKPAGVTCNDANSCSRWDVCDGEGHCGGTLYSCPEPTQCEESVTCDGFGGCDTIYRSSGSSCDDGRNDTRNDVCDGHGGCAGTFYTCAPGQCEVTSVPNGVDCTVTYQPGGSPCNDGVACTHTDTCNGLGVCGGTQYNCPEPNECQVSVACDGEGDCNVVNRQSGYGCTSDGLSCTRDICDGQGACHHPLQNDTCLIDGQCYASSIKDPLNECRGCNPSTSQTEWTDLASGASCSSDELSCTNDVCDGEGACVHQLVSGNCLIEGVCFAGGTANASDLCQGCLPELTQDAWSNMPENSVCEADEFACTEDICDGEGACIHPVGTGQCLIEGQCYSDEESLPGEQCVGCVSSVSQSGPSDLPQGVSCEDSVACTHTDLCDGAGVCAGTEYTCPDPNQCETSVFCDGEGGCDREFQAQGTACDDETDCTYEDACDGSGVCSGTAYTCRSPEQCEEAVDCDGAGDCTVTYKTAEASCDDEIACTHTDLCDGTGGCDGTSYTCPEPHECQISVYCDGEGGCASDDEPFGVSCTADELSCTDDVCDGAGECSHEPRNDTCLIDGVCFMAGTRNPENQCQVCTPQMDQVAWSPMQQGVACDDGQLCTYDDQCDGEGYCLGVDYACELGSCDVSASCDGDGGCIREFREPGTDCDDNNPCTLYDMCEEQGVCAGEPRICDTPPIPDCMDDLSMRMFEREGECEVETGECLYVEHQYDCPTTCDPITGLCVGGLALDCLAPPEEQCRVAPGYPAYDPETNLPICAYPAADEGTTCDDGEMCTSGDACDEFGNCVGDWHSCEDDRVCVSSSVCDGNGGCETEYLPSGTACDDEDPCTAFDQCDEIGGCAGSAYVCDEEGPCVVLSSCDGEGGCILELEPEGTRCDDGNPCTSDDQCDAEGVCGGSDYSCEETGPCIDSVACDGEGGCVIEYLPEGAECDDGDPCTEQDQCTSEGVCAGEFACQEADEDAVDQLEEDLDNPDQLNEMDTSEAGQEDDKVATDQADDLPAETAGEVDDGAEQGHGSGGGGGKCGQSSVVTMLLWLLVVAAFPALRRRKCMRIDGMRG